MSGLLYAPETTITVSGADPLVIHNTNSGLDGAIIATIPGSTRLSGESGF